MKYILAFLMLAMLLACDSGPGSSIPSEPVLIVEKDGVRVYYFRHKYHDIYFTTKGEVIHYEPSGKTSKLRRTQ